MLILKCKIPKSAKSGASNVEIIVLSAKRSGILRISIFAKIYNAYPLIKRMPRFIVS